MSVNQIAFFRHGEEDETVHRAHQFLIEIVGIYPASTQCGAQLIIAGAFAMQESRTQRTQRSFHTVTQTVTGPAALFLQFPAPVLPQASGRFSRGTQSGAGGMHEPPHGIKCDGICGREHGAQIYFQVAGTGQSRVVTHQPQRRAVRDQSPQEPTGFIQELLH